MMLMCTAKMYNVCSSPCGSLRAVDQRTWQAMEHTRRNDCDGKPRYLLGLTTQTRKVLKGGLLDS